MSSANPLLTARTPALARAAGRLRSRASRPAEHEAENRAFHDIAARLSADPARTPELVVHYVLELCRAESAGISLMQTQAQRSSPNFERVAGRYGRRTPCDAQRWAAPFALVMEQRDVVLFDAEDNPLDPPTRDADPIAEGLVAPLSAGGTPVGTIWALCHEKPRHFDPEDARLIATFASLAGAAQFILIQARGAERLRAGLEAVGVASFEWTAATDSVVCSPMARWLFGLRPEQQALRLSDLLERFHHEDRFRARSGITATLSLSTPHTWCGEVRTLLADRQTAFVHARCAAFHPPSGERAEHLVGFTWSVADTQSAGTSAVALDAYRHPSRDAPCNYSTPAGSDTTA